MLCGLGPMMVEDVDPSVIVHIHTHFLMRCQCFGRTRAYSFTSVNFLSVPAGLYLFVAMVSMPMVVCADGVHVCTLSRGNRMVSQF